MSEKRNKGGNRKNTHLRSRMKQERNEVRFKERRSKSSEEVVGKVSLARDGYGFVTVQGDENDIFQTVDSSQNSGEPTVITNIEELAEAIGKKISKSMSVDCLNTIDLRINGNGGDEWIIRKI